MVESNGSTNPLTFELSALKSYTITIVFSDTQRDKLQFYSLKIQDHVTLVHDLEKKIQTNHQIIIIVSKRYNLLL